MNQKFRISPKFIFCLFFIALFGIATVSAAPPLPMEFYGPVTVSGGIPAPVGSVITAQINGVDRGSFTTDVIGQYGGAGNFVPRLIVQATEQDMSGQAIVTFYVNGVKADQQENYVAGNSRFLGLTIGSPTTQPTTAQPTTQQPTTQQTTAVPTTSNQQPNKPLQYQQHPKPLQADNSSASGAPGLPESFYGTVTVANNQYAPFGTMIQANGPGVSTGIENNPITGEIPGSMVNVSEL